MRYATGGGLTAKQRKKRESVRLQAAARFAEGASQADVVREFKVTSKTASVWHQAWRAGGKQALVSKGPPTPCRLSPQQVIRLGQELERGPAVHGWEDQRWTLARIRVLIKRLFRVEYTVPGVWYLLRRNGFSCQVPVRRATERDDEAIQEWREEVWEQVKPPRRPGTDGSSSRTSPESR
jgi:transposase